ncbi:MAG: hypothetical protein U0R19_34825 [Bryobacteraceae bacterium]
MATLVHEVEVAALYRNPGDGEIAAQTLRERGCPEVDVLPVNSKTIPLLHTKERSRPRRICFTAAAIPGGFILGAICASPIALIFGPYFTAPIAVVTGIAGAVLATDYAQRRAAPKVVAHEGEGVIVRAECPREQEAAVVDIMKHAHADDISVDEYDETDVIYA